MTPITQLYMSLQSQIAANNEELAEMDANLAAYEARIPNYDPTRHYARKAVIEASNADLAAQLDELRDRMTAYELSDIDRVNEPVFEEG